MLYAFFASLDVEIIPEDLTNHGQVDLTIKLAGYIYVIEIKLVRDARGKGDRDVDPSGIASASANTNHASGAVAKCATDTPVAPASNPALAQIQVRGYSQKYQDAPGKGLFEVGLVFSSCARNLIQSDWYFIARFQRQLRW